MTIDRKITEALARRAGFVSLRGYVTSRGEVADYLINGNADYSRVKGIKEERTRASLRIANSMTAEAIAAATRPLYLSDATKADGKRYGNDNDYLSAKWDAVVKSLSGTVKRIEQGNAAADKAVGGPVVLAQYDAVAPGIVRDADGNYHVRGTYVAKQTILAGKVVNSGDQTLWKAEVKGYLLSRAIAEDDGIRDMPLWLSFRLSTGKFDSVTGNGVTLTPADL